LAALFTLKVCDGLFHVLIIQIEKLLKLFHCKDAQVGDGELNVQIDFCELAGRIAACGKLWTVLPSPTTPAAS
jgi:hypothetical protein